MSSVSIHVARDFSDPAIGPDIWDELLRQGGTVVGSLAWESQRLWWQEHEHLGELRLLLARRQDRPVAIAPFFIDSGMVMNLCPVGRLDFIGTIDDPAVLDRMIAAATELVQDFIGLRVYFVPDRSRTSRHLRAAAERLRLDCVLEDEQPAPVILIQDDPEAALACTRKSTLLRREKQLRREGTLEVHHFGVADEILPQLETFFAQHIDRWHDTPTPSRFTDVAERQSFTRRTEAHAQAGWLRFSRLDWNGQAIAFHRGACFHGHYNYGRSTYDPRFAHRSPGSVLLRHLILAAIDEGAHTFDFGMGDEEYKYRHTTHEDRLQTWGLYPT